MQIFEFMNQSQFTMQDSSDFEKELESELDFNDISMSDKGRNEDYNDININKDVKVNIPQQDKYLFSFL
jgi:hypothetical protein